jgi:hypothetical protein
MVAILSVVTMELDFLVLVTGWVVQPEGRRKKREEWSQTVARVLLCGMCWGLVRMEQIGTRLVEDVFVMVVHE